MRIDKLRMDWRAVVAVVATTTLLIIDEYHTFFLGLFADRFDAVLLTRTVVYLFIPLLIILLIFRESPAKYGMRLGDWKAGLALTLGACAAMAVVIFFVARTPAFQDYYGSAYSGSLPLWLADGIELFGWEFFFRGFLFFALYRTCGPIALFLQAVPFTMAHIGKPELETISCILGGAGFGYVAWRTRSFLYPFLIHWFIYCFTVWLASGGLG